MAEHGDKDRKTDPQGKPLGVEVKLFLVGGVFFLPVALAYMYFADLEPVGTTAFLLLDGMWFMLAGYLWLVGRRTTPRFEDNSEAEIDERAGEIGVYSPHSWWPLVLGVAAALAFLGTAVGWWITGIGVALGLVGLVGQTYEFSRGQHAH